MNNNIFMSLLLMPFLLACNKDDDNNFTIGSAAPTVKQEVTYEVIITEDITYGEGLTHESLNSSNSSVMPLFMDSYVPENNLQNRPVLMLSLIHISEPTRPY